MKILFVSLGCDKNLVDSEVMIGLLGKKGFSFTDNETEADVIVVNTCCFINDAKEESINTILEMAEYRKEGSCKALIVAGCLAQRYKQEIVDEIPEVDAVLGTTTYDAIVETVEKVLEGQKELHFEDIDRLVPEQEGARTLTTGGHFCTEERELKGSIFFYKLIEILLIFQVHGWIRGNAAGAHVQSFLYLFVIGCIDDITHVRVLLFF